MEKNRKFNSQASPPGRIFIQFLQPYVHECQIKFCNIFSRICEKYPAGAKKGSHFVASTSTGINLTSNHRVRFSWKRINFTFLKRNFCGINERKYKILRTTLVKIFFFFRRGVMCTYEQNLNVRQDRHSNYSIKTILLCRFENFTRSFEWVGFLFHFILFLISFLLDQK